MIVMDNKAEQEAEGNQNQAELGNAAKNLSGVSSDNERQSTGTISFVALLGVLNRLKSQNRNPERDWYLGWNSALDCLINDINARQSSEASLTVNVPENGQAAKPEPWCNPCGSFHPYPTTFEGWRELRCQADRRNFTAEPTSSSASSDEGARDAVCKELARQLKSVLGFLNVTPLHLNEDDSVTFSMLTESASKALDAYNQLVKGNQ